MKSARLPGFGLVTLAGTSSSGRRGSSATGKGRTARVLRSAWLPLAAVGRAVRRLDAATSMVDAEARAALDRRWAGLPERARVPEQVVGKAFIGCEGTHGVFPRCNFTCSPCYHSSDANHVRVDGGHTRAAVERQMGLLRSTRGPHAHAQLIGGEVSLLDADDHAAALQVMERFGRVPMSFTHGDFDYDYLERIVLDAKRRPRLDKISFAAHFDITMRGRRSVPRPRTERDLDQARHDFCAMFDRLRSEHGVASFLAHNMTVTPDNLDQIPDTVRACRSAGFSMLSFQPAAYMGDSRRWREDYRSFGSDEVWAQVEAGIGARLPWRVMRYGDDRCNRTAIGVCFGQRWVPLLDDAEPADLQVRDLYYQHFGGANIGASAPALFAAKLSRLLIRRPGLAAVGVRWVGRLVRRAGGLSRVIGCARRREVRPLTFVMHSFIDADAVGPAWELMRRGEASDDSRVRAAQERLEACVYHMAHPETGELIPACVQHSVLDPAENKTLRNLLPVIQP